MNKRRGLGKGLQALIPEMQEDNNGKDKVKDIYIQNIQQNPHQPRQVFDQEKLEELAVSIKEHGVVQPIIVRLIENGEYELIAGERRLRACRYLGVETIPAIIMDCKEKDVIALSLIENIQREDLNPLEEAVAYKQLIDDHGLSQEEVSNTVGKSRSMVANTVRLLNLPGKLKEMLISGILSAGHARAILAIQDSKKQIAVAGRVEKQHLSVRQTEEIVKNINKEKESKKKDNKEQFVLELEEKLKSYLEARVKVKENSKGGGKVEIDYNDAADLRRILSIMFDDRKS